MKRIPSIFLLTPLIFLLISADTPSRNPFPEIERYKLKNGLEVIFADYGELPVTSISIFVNAGKKNETPGQQGLARLTADALLFGNKEYSRTDQDRWLYRTGGDISVSVNENFTVISAQFLNKDLERGMSLVSAALLKPIFPQQDIEDEKGFVLAQSKFPKMDIGDLADVYGNYFVYGIAHPLGRHLYAAQYQKIAFPQIVDFYTFNYTPGNTKVVISGKPDRDRVKKVLEDLFGGWTATYGEVNGSAYDIPAIRTKAYAFVGKAEATQACLEWFKKAPAAGSKDVAAFQLANAIFSDRLGKEIREKKGYTYGIYSSYSEQQNDEIFRTKTQVRNEVTYATITSFDEVLNNYYTKGATDAELKKFKTILKSNILSLEEPSAFAELINPWVYKDYAKRRQYLAELDAIDLATLNKTVKKYFTPDSYKLMIAGDETALKDQLDKLPGLQKLDLSVIEKDQ